MTIRQLALWATGILLVIVAYVINYYGGFHGDKVFRQALSEAGGDQVAALTRLGPAFTDPQGNLVRLTLNRTIRREGKATGLPDHQLGNAVLSKLSLVPSLQFLGIGPKTWIDDDGMEQIAKLPQLEVLSMKFTQLSKRGLDRLRPLTTLKVLYVSEAKLTEQDAIDFEEAVRGCDVVLWPSQAQQASDTVMQIQQEFIDDVREGQLIRVSP